MITIFDIGARFGIHPSIEPIKEISKIILVEPEIIEFSYLKNKYLSNKNVNVVDYAFVNQSRSGHEDFLNVYDHPGLTSLISRDSEIDLHLESKATTVCHKQNVKLISGADFCDINKLSPDIIKIDIEGYELEAIKGFGSYLDGVVGIRSEVSFDNVFGNETVQFSKLHDFLFQNGFKLLGFDYKGKGFAQSKFVNSNNYYGLLQTTDAVWYRPYLKIKNTIDINKIIRSSIFCGMNSAFDVALSILKNTKLDYKLFEEEEGKFLMNIIAKYLYELRSVPSITYSELQNEFYSIFRKKFPSQGTFYNSDYNL